MVMAVYCRKAQCRGYCVACSVVMMLRRPGVGDIVLLVVL